MMSTMLFHFIYEDEKDSCQPSNNRAAELKSDCYESKQYIKNARLILSKRVWNVQTHRDYNPQKSSFQYRKWCTTTNYNAHIGCLFPSKKRQMIPLPFGVPKTELLLFEYVETVIGSHRLYNIWNCAVALHILLLKVRRNSHWRPPSNALMK